ncbi:membrane protein YqaA with SNARE-associated domain [Cricetibacter osteomyelitidis]|uniref:Membrane protein YqaA with SNARE-associated domain n=2 Tax=Cricetibacter osteomyelitidis TaxID=1521931 RepID=A0A4R2T135_9PAST|nr:membrane protein YqaA with SNARE-associated domain [Cricetibacter osteomyelitidis]
MNKREKMFDLLLSWDFWAGFFLHNQLWIMFVSAFLSATVLPGNSEAVFLGYASSIFLQDNDYFSSPLLWLVLIAVLGNSLGSLSTYWIGRWFPQSQQDNAKTQWAIAKIQRYGTPMLFFSWLPIVGDLLCAIAGWLRLNPKSTVLFIVIGKIVRYVFLLFLLKPMIVIGEHL